MTFNLCRVHTAVTADEVKRGTRVLFANNLDVLKQKVNAYDKENDEHEATEPSIVESILDESHPSRFRVRPDGIDRTYDYPLVYILPEVTHRPFECVGELVHWWECHYQNKQRPINSYPFIWVEDKEHRNHLLIDGYCPEIDTVLVAGTPYSLDMLYKKFRFEDGLPIGMPFEYCSEEEEDDE